MWIGRKPFGVTQFVAEIFNVLLGQAAFQKRASVNAWAVMNLKVNKFIWLIAN